MFVSIHLHANNLRWLCRVWWTKPGDKEFTLTISGTVIRFNSLNRGSVAEEYLIPADNLKGRDDRPHLSYEFGKNIQSKLLPLSAGNCTAWGKEPVIKKSQKMYITWRNRNVYFFFPHFSFLCLHDASTWMQILVSFPKDKLYFYTFQWPGMELRKVKNHKLWILL